jgi:hypothetical protein
MPPDAEVPVLIVELNGIEADLLFNGIESTVKP